MDFIPEKKNEVPVTHRMFAHVSSLLFHVEKKRTRKRIITARNSSCEKVMF